jgi:lipopolysaccharide transport system permease protein
VTPSHRGTPSPERTRLAGARELWAFRELLFALVERNLTMRYQRSILGAVWTLLNPLLSGLVLVTVFSVILRVRTPQYWAFLISGYFAWVFTLNSLGISAGLISSHSFMTRSVAFPADILVISTVISRFIEFAIEMLLVVVVLAVVRHEGLTLGLIALPLVMLLHAILTAGIMLPIAALGVFFEDVQHAVPVGLTMLTMVSPVYYPMSSMPEHWQPILSLNPFAGVLMLYHATVYDGRLPTGGEWIAPIISTLTVFTLGLALFRWKRAYFAEVV